MAKIRLTKTELKKQKDSLKRFNRYLPTLQLKKQQLQVEIFSIGQKQEEKRAEQEFLRSSLSSWISVFGEPFPLVDYVEIQRVETSHMNIAGVLIPVFKEVIFMSLEWDLLTSPLWVDRGIKELKRHVVCDVEVAVLQQQIDLLAAEFRMTSQRVNLFEKVMIPEAKVNIKRINVQLGDEQAAGVVRGKIAKKGLSQKQGVVS